MTEDYVREFFNQNARLFTIMGVFGAISVYFTQLELESKWRRLGIVSSLTIFILVAVIILRNLPPDDSEQEPFDYVVNNPREYKSLVLFYVAFYAVVLSVSAIVIRFSNTLIFLIQFLFTIFGIYFIIQWIDLIEVEDDVDLTLGESPALLIVAAYMMRNAIWGGAVGGGILILLWLQGFVPVEQLLAFQINSLVLAVIIGVLGGITLGGLIYTIFMLSIITLHFMLAWVIREGMEEEYLRVMERIFGWEFPNDDPDNSSTED